MWNSECFGARAARIDFFCTRRDDPVVFIVIIQINTLAGRARECGAFSDLLWEAGRRDEENGTRRAIGACPLACFGIPITLRATSDSVLTGVKG